MREEFLVESNEQLIDVIRLAREHTKTLDVRSRSSLTQLGRTMQTDATLDLSALNKVVLYEPEELVITVQPALALAELKSLLAEQGQMLAFEPPEFSLLYDSNSPGGSIGGAVAINAAGPRRFKAGAARDFMLGVKGVSGFGKTFRAGGRVVKNVTGYDVAKLMAGSFGTLGVMTEITLKVMPQPEAEISVLIYDIELPHALALMKRLMASTIEASGVVFLPRALAVRFDEPQSTSVMLVRLEGPHVALNDRLENVKQLFETESIGVLDEDRSRRQWALLRDLHTLFNDGSALWRITCPVSRALEIMTTNPSEVFMVDWAGGAIWLAHDDVPVVEEGSAMLFRQARQTSSALPFLPHQDAQLSALSQRIKNSFDPHGLLNPGRMLESI